MMRSCIDIRINPGNSFNPIKTDVLSVVRICFSGNGREPIDLGVGNPVLAKWLRLRYLRAVEQSKVIESGVISRRA